MNAGAKMLADSRIENIKKIKQSGIVLPIMLLRSPMLSEVEHVIQYCDVSLNTELSVIQSLSTVASKLNIIHDIIVMVELGDLREGVMPADLMSFIKNIIHLPHITLKGIGTNLACRYQRFPQQTKLSH